MWFVGPILALASILPLVALARPAPPEPPAQLRCLARHYPVKPELHGGRWYGVTPGGERLLWDDGRAKSPRERIEAPDLEDTLSMPYPRGPIGSLTSEEQDPGRARVEALLSAAYGVPRHVPLTTGRFFGKAVRVHERIAPALRRVIARLEAAVAREPSLRGYLTGCSGGYNVRHIKGTSRYSAHSWGIALDLGMAHANYWRWQRGPPTWRNRIPQAVVDAFEAEGFVWGGRWYHYDTPHFEYRPELLDPDCSPQR